MSIENENSTGSNYYFERCQELEEYLGEINAIMWETFHNPHHQFATADGERIAEVLEQWAASDVVGVGKGAQPVRSGGMVVSTLTLDV